MYIGIKRVERVGKKDPPYPPPTRLPKAEVKIAALFVETNGGYFDSSIFDPWDINRDARLFNGPGPVIAHPPCERWGRYWSGGPSARVRRKLGDDNGCFASALKSVETFGGVLEHPEASHAWKRFGLDRPSRLGGWRETRKGYTCCVAQGHYGHLAQKLTWLYVVSFCKPRELKWGLCPGRVRLDIGYHSAEERKRAKRTGVCQRLSKRQRAATPTEFRILLTVLAREVV